MEIDRGTLGITGDMADRYFLPHFPQDDRPGPPNARLTGSRISSSRSRDALAGIGDRLTVFDGQGTEADAELVGTHQDFRRIYVTTANAATIRPRHCPRVKSRAGDCGSARPIVCNWLVEKATELGVDRFIPLQTGRSVVAPGAVKLDKMRQVVVEACKQSGRNQLMQIDSLMPWKQFVAQEITTLSTVVADPGGPPPCRRIDVAR